MYKYISNTRNKNSKYSKQEIKMVNLNQSTSRRRLKGRRLINDDEYDFNKSEQARQVERKKDPKEKVAKDNLMRKAAMKNLFKTLSFLKTMIEIWSYELCPLSMTTMKEFYQNGKSYSKVGIVFLERLSYMPFLLFRLTKHLYQQHWQHYSWKKRIFITSWCTCQIICFSQKYEAGILFFTISLLILITTVGLDHGEVEEGSISAYSVFNKGCERLLGTYNVEEWERLIRYTPEEQ